MTNSVARPAVPPRRRKIVVAVFVALGVGSFQGTAQAYEASDVRDGGSLHGKVVYAGTPPAPARTPIERDQKVCGAQAVDQSLVIGKDGALANAVVFLGDIESGRAVDLQHAQPLDNVHCTFEPHVQALSVGQALLIRNSDPILHNTHAYVLEGQGNVFNIALPQQGKEIHKVLKKPGVHQVKCDAGHTWMNAYFLVFEHPYHAVTGAGGSFAIRDIPAGTYTLEVWHETLGRVQTTVEVQAGKDIEVPVIALNPKK